MMEEAALCFPPVADRRTRVLILGSLPGARSLALSQYYGHPRNHFWPIAAGLTGIDLPALSYEDRLAGLLARRLGLWDVVAEAVRPGSLDQHLRAIRANSLGEFVAGLPELRAIGFNGTTASRIGRRQLEQDAGFADRTVALIDLPSTSPANTMPLSRKAELWRQLAAYIE
ncbi:hypoxanthine-DNA glycosylase [Sphingobium jiangsuense]|uniref:Hypoxanthine-DNA glycosylase n=1 Tax=Sphingobium jiangsuense TaxID=870476 RepID=A0A7W6BE62_9SPHN|nr:DNA-deoxyinosine glycosylase [Sphingobium jiangsuense]MBB3925231.1 hypoxanthine-DNA glycosylase [Sphingobium jiangsuense]